MEKQLNTDKLNRKGLKLSRYYYKITLCMLWIFTMYFTYSIVSNDYNKLKSESDNIVTAYSNKLTAIQKSYDDRAEEFNEVDKIKQQIELLTKENERLQKQYKEVLEDNIHLQNSLKLAAQVGIKPQRYNVPPNITSRSNLDRSRYIGKFLGTAYTPSPRECSNNKGITYSGKPIIPGLTIAVDTKYWPIGTIFYVKGLGYVTAMDTGSKVKGKYRFDFAVLDRKFAYALGRKSWEVYLVKKGNGKVNLDMFKNNQFD